MKDCARVKKALSRYLDKEVKEAGLCIIKEHLEACPSCNREFSQLSALRALVSHKERKELSSDYLVFRLREKISEEARDSRVSWLFDAGDLSRRLIPVPIAAIFLAAVILLASPVKKDGSDSIVDHMLSGSFITKDAALGVILGVQN